MSLAMGTVTFVLGLAGSGKSWFVERLRVNKAFEEQFAAEDEHETHHAELVARLKRGEHCAVSELKFLDPTEREHYVGRLRCELGGQLHINWVCFENDLSSANANCRKRTTKNGDPTGEGHVAITERVSPTYVIPDGAVVLRIHVT